MAIFETKSFNYWVIRIASGQMEDRFEDVELTVKASELFLVIEFTIVAQK
jgi:hypothetical protein